MSGLRYFLACSVLCGAAAAEAQWFRPGWFRREPLPPPLVPATAIPTGVQTGYREQWVTQYQPTYRYVQVPVTEYRPEARWRRRWNPFAKPRLETRMVARTHWETRTEVVQTPVLVRQWAPSGIAVANANRVAPGATPGQQVAQLPVAATSPTSSAAGGGDPFATSGTAYAAWPNGYVTAPVAWDEAPARRDRWFRRRRTVPVPAMTRNPLLPGSSLPEPATVASNLASNHLPPASLPVSGVSGGTSPVSDWPRQAIASSSSKFDSAWRPSREPPWR